MKEFKFLLKIAVFFLALIIAVSLIMSNLNQAQEENDNGQISVTRILKHMGAIITPASLEDERLQDTPWIQSGIEVEGIEGAVSLNVIENYFNVYRFYTGRTFDKEATDLVNMVNDYDQEEYDSYELYFYWLFNNAAIKKDSYRDGVNAAYLAYRKIEGQDFLDKELGQLTAAERYQLANWAIEHPEAADVLPESQKENYQILLRDYRRDENVYPKHEIESFEIYK